MALYDTRFGLPQSVVDYLNQGLPNIYQNIDNTLPATIMPTEPGVQSPILEQLYPQNSQGGGDGYSVYNPDPGMTRTSKNYNSRPAYEAAFGTMMGDPVANIATGALNKFDVMGSYREKPPSGLETLFDQYIKTSLPAQLLNKGLNFLKNRLPVNKAGIFQNELLGGGFMLDNIGRIVSAPGKYNTPEGIMAGYNPVSGGGLYTLSGGQKGEPPTYGLDKAYDKRRETIAKALEKMGMSKEDIKAAIAGEYEGDAPINPITGKPTTLVDRLGLFNQSQNLLNKTLTAADIIFNKKLEEKKLQQSDFGQAAKTMAQARGITKSLASRPSSTSGGYQQGPGGSGSQATGASKSQSQAGPGFSGSGSAAEMGSF